MESTKAKSQQMALQGCLLLLSLSMVVLGSAVTTSSKAIIPPRYDTAFLNRSSFPAGFIFGTASSAYQVSTFFNMLVLIFKLVELLFQIILLWRLQVYKHWCFSAFFCEFLFFFFFFSMKGQLQKVAEDQVYGIPILTDTQVGVLFSSPSFLMGSSIKKRWTTSLDFISICKLRCEPFVFSWKTCSFTVFLSAWLIFVEITLWEISNGTTFYCNFCWIPRSLLNSIANGCFLFLLIFNILWPLKSIHRWSFTVQSLVSFLCKMGLGLHVPDFQCVRV